MLENTNLGAVDRPGRFSHALGIAAIGARIVPVTVRLKPVGRHPKRGRNRGIRVSTLLPDIAGSKMKARVRSKSPRLHFSRCAPRSSFLIEPRVPGIARPTVTIDEPARLVATFN